MYLDLKIIGAIVVLIIVLIASLKSSRADIKELNERTKNCEKRNSELNGRIVSANHRLLGYEPFDRRGKYIPPHDLPELEDSVQKTLNEVESLNNEVLSLKNEKNLLKRENHNALKENRRLSKELDTRNEVYKKMLEGNRKAIPYLAGMIADYLTYDLEVYAKKLDWGASQAREKKVKDIREIRKEARDLIEHYKEYEYQIKYLNEIYPEIDELLELDYSELPRSFSKFEEDEDFDETKRYLNKSEWDTMSVSQRNQLALDRYIESRRKSKWQIGRDYELFVGSKYETQGWQVLYTGSTMKLEDMGRDLICKCGNFIHIVQCKYWSTQKQIHEKHIFQLYGTTISYKVEHPEYKDLIIKPVFVTNIQLSSKARAVANYLGITVVTNLEMDDFPRIKCVVRKDEFGLETKIYHLPMDQQYDSAILQHNKGDFWATTVAEAERSGFRRAYRWFGN